ncbi:DUF397 domain-containing protein [Streptomyces griseochromogenes]|uniref:DUF397 domain-containing protein n=1 Tax=Streptomyces griseochromogenes TaxID=68214 RepID=UPI0027E2FC34|nr:DUF397 domain-containing protein [Streptomyces griseochromogenes]
MIRTWCKSSYSGQENTCLELLTPPPPGQAPVRDSKRPGSTVITFRASAWTSFVRAIAEDDVPSPSC